MQRMPGCLEVMKTIELQQVEISTLKPAAYNPRKISPEAFARLEASLKEFGLVEPIIVNKRTGYTVVGGHQRLEILRRKGDTSAPCVVLDLPLAREKALNVALNNQAMAGAYDFHKLADLLQEIDTGEFDVSTLTGFDKAELERISNYAPADGREELDPVPEPPDEAKTQKGDVWQVGRHRLLCGDSSKREDVDHLLEGAPIHVVNTDPPYNVNIEPRSNNAISAGRSSTFAGDIKAGHARAKPGKNQAKYHHQGFDLARDPGKSKPTTTKMRPKDRELHNDFMSEDDFDKTLRAWFGNLAHALLPGRAFYVWGGYANCKSYPGPLKDSGLYFSQAIIWVKGHPILGRKDFMGNHEWCFYGWREGAAHQFYGPNNIPDVWEVKSLHHANMVHLTEKPVELASRAIQYSSQPGENVLDLFGGSGSTLIACEQNGRSGYAMELDELYCDVIVKRWQNFTGQKAKNLTRPAILVD